MDTYDLIQLGAQVATQGNRLLLSNREIPLEFVQEYWVHARYRISHWQYELRQLEQGGDKCRTWHPIIGEIISAELLQRIWGTVVVAYDSTTTDRGRAELITNLAPAQLEISNRMLAWLKSGGFDKQTIAKIRTLHRRIERWTDLLLSELVVTCDVQPFAFNINRVNEFHDDLYGGRAIDIEDRWKLLLKSFDRAFLIAETDGASDGELNQNIADTILNCLDHDPFDTRLVKDPYWVQQVSLETERTQLLVDQLLQSEE